MSENSSHFSAYLWMTLNTLRVNTMATALRRVTHIELQIFALILLLLRSVTPASAACLNWPWMAANPDYRLIYEGTVDGHPIRMMLHLDISTGRLDGIYGYNDQPNTLVLAGSMQPNSIGIDLDERDKKDAVTGHFNLKFFHQRPVWESEENYKKESKDSCGFLTGKWESPSRNKSFDVSLQQNGVSIPGDDNKREMNEVTAYKLRKAMLDDDRKVFALLLQYPFHSESGHQIVSTWNSPEDVIKNYRNIVHFSFKQIKTSVPHVLQTSGARSQFMNRSIYLENGKVTRICEEACPVMP